MFRETNAGVADNVAFNGINYTPNSDNLWPSNNELSKTVNMVQSNKSINSISHYVVTSHVGNFKTSDCRDHVEDPHRNHGGHRRYKHTLGTIGWGYLV